MALRSVSVNATQEPQAGGAPAIIHGRVNFNIVHCTYRIVLRDDPPEVGTSGSQRSASAGAKMAMAPPGRVTSWELKG